MQVLVDDCTCQWSHIGIDMLGLEGSSGEARAGGGHGSMIRGVGTVPLHESLLC